MPESPASLAREVVVAGSVAAVVSGAPSTVHAVWTGASPLEASLAAGTLLLPGETRASRLLPAATAVHLTLSLGWAAALAATLPRRHTLAWATLAGAAITALDLGMIGRRFPRIRALPLAPQVADHLVYAWTVAAVLARRRAARGVSVREAVRSTIGSECGHTAHREPIGFG